MRDLERPRVQSSDPEALLAELLERLLERAEAMGISPGEAQAFIRRHRKKLLWQVRKAVQIRDIEEEITRLEGLEA